MPVQLSFKEGLPEAAVKARKSPFITAVVIVSHLLFSDSFWLVRPIKPEVKFTTIS